MRLFRATIIRPEEATPGTPASGHARRMPAPIGSPRGITNIATIPAIGNVGNGTGTTMTTSAGSIMTAGGTVVGTSTTTTISAGRKRALTGAGGLETSP